MLLKLPPYRGLALRLLDLSNNSLDSIGADVLWTTSVVVNVSLNYLGRASPAPIDVPPVPSRSGARLASVVDLAFNSFGGSAVPSDVLSSLAAGQLPGWVFNMSGNCYYPGGTVFAVGLGMCGGQGLTCMVQQQRDCFSVPGTPNSPRDVTVSPDVQSAVVSWKPPAKSYPMPSNYTLSAVAVDHKDDAQLPVTMTVSSLTTEVTMTGLVPGAAYSVVVEASTGIGPGTASSASVLVTPCAAPSTTPPQPPTDIVSTVGIRNVTLAWTPAVLSRCWNGTVDAWNVTTKCVTANGTTGFTKWLMVGAGNTSTVIPGLPRLLVCNYSVSIAGGNGAGWSDAAIAAVGMPVDVPSTPKAVAAVPSNNRSVLVQWQRPVDDGGSPVLSYTVSAIPVNAGLPSVNVSVNAGSDVVQAVPVDGLVAAQAYVVSVQAWNIAGSSAAAVAGTKLRPFTTAATSRLVLACVVYGFDTICVCCLSIQMGV